MRTLFNEKLDMETKNDKLIEANLLSKEITQLERFIYTLDVSGHRREESDVKAIINKRVETKTTYSIFGRRFFGIGAHEHTIDVPTSTIESLVILAKEILSDKKSQLAELFNTTQIIESK